MHIYMLACGSNAACTRHIYAGACGGNRADATARGQALEQEHPLCCRRMPAATADAAARGQARRPPAVATQ